MTDQSSRRINPPPETRHGRHRSPSELLSRRHQMFPQLTEAELARMQRFGTRHT